jgi:hypothetical protein
MGTFIKPRSRLRCAFRRRALRTSPYRRPSIMCLRHDGLCVCGKICAHDPRLGASNPAPVRRTAGPADLRLPHIRYFVTVCGNARTNRRRHFGKTRYPFFFVRIQCPVYGPLRRSPERSRQRSLDAPGATRGRRISPAAGRPRPTARRRTIARIPPPLTRP